ncbi:MAG: MnmC family methyltransferase [Chthoniobacterales bacterium]
MKQRQAENSEGRDPRYESAAAKSLKLGDYEIHQAWEGFASIRQVSSGEIMHSRTAPMEEARRIYVDQAHLAERLGGANNTDALVLWDVGLGAGANAMAAITCYEEVAGRGRVRPLHLISFENDLDSFRLAADHPTQFPYLNHEAAAVLLTQRDWRSARFPALKWSLVLGDFTETMSGALGLPDLIFYDMFSSRSASEPWSYRTFRRLFEHCGRHDVELFTYTCSTANRAALLAAGFWLARGRNAGPKIETTIALSPSAATNRTRSPREILSIEWLQKWNRSTAKFPHDIDSSARPAFEKLIREHEQFRNSGVPERLSSTTQNSR